MKCGQGGTAGELWGNLAGESVLAKVEINQTGEPGELGWYLTRNSIGTELEHGELRTVAELRRHLAGDVVAGEGEDCEGLEVAVGPGDGAGEGIGAQVQLLQVGEAAETLGDLTGE